MSEEKVCCICNEHKKFLGRINPGQKLYCMQCQAKITEEVTEYQNNKNPEELADILEVIYRISELKGVSRDELEEIRNKKASERGAFDKNLFLIDTKED